MNVKEKAFGAVAVASLILVTGGVLGQALSPQETVTAEPEALFAPTSSTALTAAEVVTVRFCPPVKGTASCYDCPQEFEIEACVTNVSDLASFSGTVCFDHDAIEVQGVQPSGLAQECELQWEEAQGCVVFSAHCASGVSGLGPIAKLSMRRKGTGFPTWLTWQQVELRDSAGQTLATTTERGCVASACIEGDVWRSCDCKVDVADVVWCVVDWLIPIGSVCPRCDIDVDGGVSYDDCWAITRRYFSRCPECVPSPASNALSSMPSAWHQEVTGQSTALVSVVPRDQTLPQAALLGIDVEVQNASALFGFELGLAFDPSVLQVEGVQVGPFVRGGPGYDPLPLGPQIDNQSGRVQFGAVGIQPVSGSGTLAHVAFRAAGQGSSVLDLIDVKLCTADILHANIGCAEPDEVHDGQVVVLGFNVYLPVLIKSLQ